MFFDSSNSSLQECVQTPIHPECHPTSTPVIADGQRGERSADPNQMSKRSQQTISTEQNRGTVSVIQGQASGTTTTTTSTTTGSLQLVPQLVPATPAGGGGGKAKMKKTSGDKDSDEYRQRRERNNLAVKKSRMRSKQKAQDTQQRVNELKEENERLEAKIKLLSKELSVLKDLFLEHAHNLADNVQAPGAEGASPAHNNNNNNNGACNNNNNSSQ
ncbi:CCAAT/enhancer-binding protein gamma isoform X1 [Oncorhynchus nerka]|uniref:CCAAT/enhancer-binding protein gamma isoform X1 n=2 Tax=Oncorhynchus nerka TaxID=8023 RepID=UPI0031B83DFE